MNNPIPGVLLMLATIAFVFGTAVVLLLGRLRGSRPSLARIALAFGSWAAVYGFLLVRASLSSEPRVLALDAPKRFCGFYLDCHTQVAVTAVEQLDSISRMAAAGTFYVVTLRVSSDARRARLRLAGPEVTIRDAAGRHFARSTEAESALADLRGPQGPLTQSLDPGEAFLTSVVFDLPRDARDPQLFVTDGWWADRLIEFFLVGDEDSFLHERTSFRLTT